MVHLDIKPANILRTNGNNQCKYKLCDFGLARCKFNTNNEDIDEGDSRYLAQEVLTSQFDNQLDLTKADIFSLGISAYQLITST